MEHTKYSTYWQCYHSALLVQNNFHSSLFLTLNCVSIVNIKSARCILCLAERAVVSMQSSKEAFKWYVALLRIRQHIISKGEKVFATVWF